MLKALGARSHDVILMALIELQYSAVSGALIGGALGALLSTWMGTTGIDLQALSQQVDGALAMQSVIYPEWQPWMLGSCARFLHAGICRGTASGLPQCTSRACNSDAAQQINTKGTILRVEPSENRWNRSAAPVNSQHDLLLRR